MYKSRFLVFFFFFFSLRLVSFLVSVCFDCSLVLLIFHPAFLIIISKRVGLIKVTLLLFLIVKNYNFKGVFQSFLHTT